MLLIFPVAAFVLLFRTLRQNKIDWRMAVLSSAVLWASCVVGISEALSIGNHLTRGSVAASWALICGVILLYPRRMGTGTATILNSGGRAGGGFSLAKWDPSTRGLLVGVGIIVLLVGITAVVSAPNMWDAMEYHLPRVIMWMSNHSVRFYPTPDYQQLVYGPWSEYVMLHMYLLWGSDLFVNLVEFFSLIGSMIGASLVAKMLGAGPRGQALSAIACATIPEGVLEASGPMNTYVVSFWIITTIVFLMNWNQDPSWFNTVCIGLSAGLALLTKGTAYIFLPFLVLAAWWIGSRSVRILFLKRSIILAALILLLNGQQYLRCYDLTGSPIGVPLPEAGSRVHLAMAHVSVRNTLANALRNVSLHCGTRNEGLNLRIERLFRRAIQIVGVDPDDAQQIWLGEPFHINAFSSDEGVAGNPLHLVLLSLSIGLVVWKRKEGVKISAFWYGLGIVFAFLLFSGLLMWTPWSGRYQLPLFVVGSALIGLVLERCFSRSVANGLVIALLAMASLFAVANKTRSLVRWSRVADVYHARSIQYFAHLHQKDAPTFIAAAEAVNQLNCRSVAIDTYAPALQTGHSPRSFYVYPLFPLIHADGRTREVWYTGVHNSTRRYADREAHPTPCAVVCLDCADKPEKWDQYREVGGRASVFDYIVVFSSAGTMVNTTPVLHAGS
jgi:hypothetical protein